MTPNDPDDKKIKERGKNLRSARLHITPVLHVDGVHIGEIIHVG